MVVKPSLLSATRVSCRPKPVTAATNGPRCVGWLAQPTQHLIAVDIWGNSSHFLEIGTLSRMRCSIPAGHSIRVRRITR